MNNFPFGFLCGILFILVVQFVREHGSMLGRLFLLWRSVTPTRTNQELVDVLDGFSAGTKPTWYSLAEASKELGTSQEQLTELRSRGCIFGYRDGSSWKFKRSEIERFQRERGTWLDLPHH
jgi:excisionase family DNA binding protein